MQFTMSEMMQDIQEPVIDSVEEVLPLSRGASLMRFARRVTGAQFVRYVLVGLWNTALGNGLYAYFTYRFTKYSVHGYLYSAVLSNAIAITVAFFGYKFIVFQTRGNYLTEYMRCVTVYGSAFIPGFFLLVILKNAIGHYAKLHPHSLAVAIHVLTLHPLGFAVHSYTLTLLALAPYLAQAIITFFTVFYSFFGHRKFSFKVAPSQQN
jgi:putative flippase GtrA